MNWHYPNAAPSAILRAPVLLVGRPVCFPTRCPPPFLRGATSSGTPRRASPRGVLYHVPVVLLQAGRPRVLSHAALAARPATGAQVARPVAGVQGGTCKPHDPPPVSKPHDPLPVSKPHDLPLVSKPHDPRPVRKPHDPPPVGIKHRKSKVGNFRLLWLIAVMLRLPLLEASSISVCYGPK